MKRLLATILALVMVFCLAGCGNSSPAATAAPAAAPAAPADAPAAPADVPAAAPAAAEYVFRIGTTGADGSNYAAGLYKFEELLEEYSGGRIDVQVYTNSTLGSERDLIEGVGLGTIEMCLSSTGPLPNFSKAFQLLDLPFLFEDHASAFTFLDSEYGQKILDSLSSSGIKALGVWENGFRHITSNFEIKTPEDIKGFTIRTMENDVHMKAFELAGANPIAMAWGEVYTSLQQGVLDGHENALIHIYNYNINEVQSHIALTGHFYSPAVIMINADLYNKLPADLQEAIAKAELEARTYEREFSENSDEELVEKLAERGVSINEVDKSLWREAMKDTITYFDMDQEAYEYALSLSK